MPEKSLDIKLRRLLADPACGEFILADAKDGDMAYGIGGPLVGATDTETRQRIARALALARGEEMGA